MSTTNEAARYDARVGEADLARIAELVSQAFGSTVPDSLTWIRSQGMTDLRVMRVGGEIGAALRIIPMGQFFGGRSVSMAGIAGVAVGPECRGRGLAREMMRSVVREMHDAGTAISTLFASTQPLYRQVGYEQAGALCRVTIPMSQLATISNLERGGDWRRILPEQLATIAPCYTSMATGIDGMLDRGDYIWDRVWKWRDRHREVYAAFDAQGRVEAVIAVGQSQKPDRRMQLELSELSFASVSALRRAAAFIHDFASMADDVTIACGTHHPLLSLLAQQRFEFKLYEYWMTRVLRVNDALAARGYAPAIDAELHLDIADDLIPENRGRRVLRVKNGVGEVSPGGRGDLRLDVRALAPLFSGLLSATQLRGLGELSGDDEAVARATGVFSGSSGMPSLTDAF
jgi:predicted acetyltransferase